jgi:serine/threonine protein kinase
MAEAYGIISGRYKSLVAVKMLKGKRSIYTFYILIISFIVTYELYGFSIIENVGKNEFTNFIKELEIMKTVGKHENIISLLGCCTRSGKI